jgi:sucrose synthase
MAEFLARGAEDPSHWESVSRGGVARVEERYTWKLYADRMLRLARIYGFWNFITDIERHETRRYLEMLYALMYRPLADGVGGGD